MESKKEYEYKKLNQLLNTSFNNVKYDIRSLNERLDTLKNQLTNLSTDSVYKALEEQNKVILEQQKTMSVLMTRLESLEALKKEAQKAPTVIIKEAKNISKAVETQKTAEIKIKDGEVKITKVNFKAEGNGNKNLNGEWVELTGYNVDLTGYKLHDKSRKHTYKFPEGFVIYGPVKVFTGKGKDTNTKLFWGNPRPVWNDDSDIATLKDNKNRVVSKVRSESSHTFDILK